ncbi:hypothetical protein H2200_010675 [Cladophialophora chaetospira]|uniref:Uncharacterized protein n=1 Tax=Cladophialophora chaetospira TaxID=386627 RepID=A0AA38X0P2_9EURO|nr:hypothetical protein H2200_010675 [Cladophialophora chaetospira]
MPSPALTPGRVLLILVGLETSIGPYAADWSASHVLNPRWPPHARFHNGQTMSLGMCLGLLTVYFAWKPVLGTRSNATAKPIQGKGRKDEQADDSGSGMTEKESITMSAVMGTLYWISGLSAILYPGTLWVDPEFGTGAPQAPIFVISIVLAWLGWAVEMRRLGKVKGA